MLWISGHDYLILAAVFCNVPTGLTAVNRRPTICCGYPDMTTVYCTTFAAFGRTTAERICTGFKRRLSRRAERNVSPVAGRNQGESRLFDHFLCRAPA